MYRGAHIVRGKAAKRDVALGRIYATIEIEAKTETPIHIGSGKEAPKVRNPKLLQAIQREIDRYTRNQATLEEVIRNLEKLDIDIEIISQTQRYGDTPAIPGTSLKGAVRSRLELLFKTVDNQVYSCFRHSSNAPAPAKKGTHGWRHQRIWKTAQDYRGSPCTVKEYEYFEDIQVCTVCNIFGAPGLKSRIYFGNLTAEEAETVVLEIKVKDNIIAVHEFIDRGATLNGEIIVRGLELEELGLVAIASNMNKDKPILIGRYKYRKLETKDTQTGRTAQQWVGRIAIKPKQMDIPVTAKTALDIINKLGISHEKSRNIVRLSTDSLAKLLKLAEDRARERFGKYIEEVDEVAELEKLQV